jgi:D-amino-acid oxidase
MSQLADHVQMRRESAAERYPSPVLTAGSLMTVSGERENGWERATWPVLHDLATNTPAAGVHFQPLRIYVREKDRTPKAEKYLQAHKSHAWLKHREVPKSELAEGIASATEFESVCINTAIYLPWLVSRCLENNVVLKRAVLAHVREAADLHHCGKRADVIVNCTGLSARKLGGVEDMQMVPIRGQVVVVRNDAGLMTSISGNDAPDDEISYTMTRAAGGGTILGGCYQVNNWDPVPCQNLAIRIMERAVAVCPALTQGKGIEHLSIIRHGVGLRPMRTGGPRVESEVVEGVSIVHCYGHSGSGYQSSYGSCGEAARLVNQALRASPTRARL